MSITARLKKNFAPAAKAYRGDEVPWIMSHESVYGLTPTEAAGMSRDRAMKISTVNRCVEVLSTSMAVLPTYMTNGQLDHQYPITWTSSDASVIDPATGKVTRPTNKGKLVTLTATGDGALAATELERYAAAMQRKTGLH